MAVKKREPSKPWMPVPYNDFVIRALKALADGTASESQQKRLLDWWINAACGTYDMSFRPGEDGDRETVFAEGRRFVGLQTVKLLKATIKEVKDIIE